MPTLYVIRHAQPAITGVLFGQSNPPLGAVGRAQASRIQVPDCVVYTSPLARALETALLVNPDPIVVPDLAEITYGDWDGLTWDEIEDRWPKIAQDKLKDWQRVVPPGGESWEGFTARVRHALHEIIDRSSSAVIVAHEAVNAVVANHFKKSSMNKFKQSYCEVKTYDF